MSVASGHLRKVVKKNLIKNVLWFNDEYVQRFGHLNLNVPERTSHPPFGLYQTIKKFRKSMPSVELNSSTNAKILSDNIKQRRLDYLGDSILKFIITHILEEQITINKYLELSIIRGILVSNQFLDLLGKLCFIHTRDTIGSSKQIVYSDLVEAYIGLVYLQQNGDLKQLSEWFTTIIRHFMFASDDKTMADLSSFASLDDSTRFQVMKGLDDPVKALEDLVGESIVKITTDVIRPTDNTIYRERFVSFCYVGGELLGIGESVIDEESSRAQAAFDSLDHNLSKIRPLIVKPGLHKRKILDALMRDGVIGEGVPLIGVNISEDSREFVRLKFKL